MHKSFLLMITCIIMTAACLNLSRTDNTANLKPDATAMTEKKEMMGTAGEGNIAVVELESLAGQPGFAPFAVIDDAAASGGKAIEWPEEGGEQHVATPSDSEPGQVAVSFTLPKTATVEFQMQVNMANADDDSFYYKMDSDDWNTLNNSATNGYQIITVNTYKDLAAGKHTLKILKRENGAKLDKVIIKYPAPPVPAKTEVLYANFEDNQVDGWTGRGSATLTIADKGAYQGNYSLLTTNRSAGWNGPQIDLTGKILLTGVYKISAWVKIQEGEPASEMIITMQRDKSGKSSWDRVLAQQVESNTWVDLSGDYEVKNDFDKIAMYIESSNPTLSYYIDEIKVMVVKQPEAAAVKAMGKDLPSLSELYKNYFAIGAAVELDQLKGEEGALLLKHFSSLTAENIMKPQYLSPSEDKFFFDDADRLVSYAQEHNKLIRGHTLVWHSQNAKWMFTDKNGARATRELLLQRLENYIKTVVGRYKGKVYAWDVLNEVIDGTGLRHSEWLDIIGEDYIEKAFIYAREADPKAKLFINEFGVTDKVKGETLYNLVKKLRDKKIPVDGVGMQYHISLEYPSLQAINDSLKKWNALGIDIHITELDMSVNSDVSFNPPKLPEDLAIQQANRYKEIFDIFKQYKNITNVTFWGFNDGHTWLHNFPYKKADWPLLFDANFNAKYAYWALVDPSKVPAGTGMVRAKNNFLATAKKGTPVIDGKEDAVWAKAPVNNITIYAMGSGAKGTGQVLWDEKGLYVFIKVQDSKLSNISVNTYEQDTVEIFIDEKNNKTVDYAEDDAQYRISYENEQSSSAGFPGKIVSATAVTGTGYNVEAFIPFKEIKGAPGTKIGFDLQINDDDGSGKRTSIAKWNDPTNDTYRNTSNFGTLVLSE